jgi:iron complex outermembrane receptor protein
MSTLSKHALLPLAAMLAAAHSWGHAPAGITEEIIVSASPLGKSASDNPRPISVLSGDDLLQQASATLGATLQGQVGVNAASFGPGVGTPVIRGQGANRVKVMQDNLDTLDAANASADHANSIEPLLADSIEILRGPQTLRFGNGAIGGVINVIDSRIPRALPPQSVQGALETRHTSVNDESASVLRLDGGAGQVAWLLDGLYRDSNNTDIPGSADVHGAADSTDGYIANTDSQSRGGSLGGSWIGARGYLGLSVNHSESNYGIPPGAHEHGEEEHEDEHGEHEEHEGEEHEDEHAGEPGAETVRIAMRQTRYDLKGELDDPLQGFSKARVRLGYVDYQHTELESGIPGTVFTSEALEGRVELLHQPLAGWEGALGSQWLDRDFAAVGAEAFIPPATIRSLGLFAIEEKTFGRWLVELGARAETQSIDPETDRSADHNTVSVSAGGHYQLTDRQRLTASVGRAQRAPSVEELFSHGPHLASASVDVGNADLDPETSLNWELGYRFEGPVNLEINAFYNDISDFIYKRNSGEEDHDAELPIYVYTQEGAVFSGMEAELTIPLAGVWELRLFGDTVRAELDRGGDVPRITPTRAGAELHYTAPSWEAALRTTRASRQNHPGELETATAGWTRVDAHLTWHPLANTTLFVNANNLLDEEIRNASSYLRDVAPEAGRSITLGIRQQF